MTELHTVGTNPPWEGLAGSERHAACIEAARAGDKRALDVLIAELTPLVWHVARGAGVEHSAAEDVVQTVWLALLRHIDRVAEPRALASWLITTTKREANRTRQRMAAQTELLPEYAEQVPSTEPLPETLAIDGERDRKLWQAFTKLTERCQTLLRLTVLAGRAEYREVAAAMGMPHGSIGPTRGRCLKQLRGLYDDGDGAR